MENAGRNWAGNHAYRARGLAAPTTVEELQELVAGTDSIRPLGSRHSFTDIADTEGMLVSLRDLAQDVVIDVEARTADVPAGAAYGPVAQHLQDHGWALHNLASLPHISIAGAVATGTHGSGDRSGSLTTAVQSIDYVAADGSLRRSVQGEDDFLGSVVALGALGVVTRLTLVIEPSYEVRQDLYLGIPWERVESDFDAITSAADSVSLFTGFTDEGVRQAWLKSRTDEAPDTLAGAPRATERLHIFPDAPIDAVTDQTGQMGPWLDRIPHFRMEFTPSAGAELQSEYLLPRENAVEGLRALRRLQPRFDSVLRSAEIRTVAPDHHWLSGAHERATVGFHFTWRLDEPGVYAVLPAIEDALLPLGGRPHWGKCFVAGAGELADLYPRWGDFRALRAARDPDGKFGNAFLDRVLGPVVG